MRKSFTLLFFLFLLSSSTAFSQACTPDPTIPDSLIGVFPLPYHETESPDGGITDTACINKPYEFVFTAVVGDSITLFGIMARLDSLKLATMNGVSGLPEGMTYSCNPGNCVFKSGDRGCVVLQGTVTNTAEIGEHDLTIIATVYSNLTPGGFQMTFPNASFWPGEYTLVVKEESFSNCAVVGTSEPLSRLMELKNVPNPFSEFTNINVNSAISGEFEFMVCDLTGKIVYKKQIQLIEGNNSVHFGANGLESGFYIYSIRNAQGSVSGKMIINRQ